MVRWFIESNTKYPKKDGSTETHTSYYKGKCGPFNEFCRLEEAKPYTSPYAAKAAISKNRLTRCKVVKKEVANVRDQ